MKIAFVTELSFTGKIHRNYVNMRTEFSWICSLNATHFNIFDNDISGNWDLIIIILPKKHTSHLKNIDIYNKYKPYTSKVAIMQEGPHWYFQDYTLDEQIWFYNTLKSSDILYVHNEIDKLYYNGLLNHADIRKMQSLMIEDAINISELTNAHNRKNTVIGGNFVSWYSGFDSYIVAASIDSTIYCPSMGRYQQHEEQLINKIPYSNWTDWISKLSNFKYAIHLMRTYAAGTFALNCSYLGIPCIGYNSLDTQSILHPNLTIDIGDLNRGKELLKKLHTDNNFYNEQSIITKENYKNKYSETVFLKQFNIQ